MKKFFAEDIGFKIDDGIINGTGAGQLLGILNGAGLITQIAEQDKMLQQLMHKILLRCGIGCLAKNRRKAKWYINQDVEPQVNADVRRSRIGWS